MMTESHAGLMTLIREIRTAFNQMKDLAERLHADLGITPSMRAVLEAFVQQAPRTVPEVAREKGVSRQHVQTVANALVEAGLLSPQDNPSHKRSPLHRPTEQGERLFAEIRAREAAPLARLAATLPEPEIAQAGKLLSRMNATLESLDTEGD